jgi:hypothetical protein
MRANTSEQHQVALTDSTAKTYVFDLNKGLLPDVIIVEAVYEERYFPMLTMFNNNELETIKNVMKMVDLDTAIFFYMMSSRTAAAQNVYICCCAIDRLKAICRYISIIAGCYSLGTFPKNRIDIMKFVDELFLVVKRDILTIEAKKHVVWLAQKINDYTTNAPEDIKFDAFRSIGILQEVLHKMIGGLYYAFN